MDTHKGFEKIPPPVNREKTQSQIMFYLKKKYDLMRDRTQRIENIRDMKKEVYNMTKSINSYDDTINSKLMLLGEIKK